MSGWFGRFVRLAVPATALIFWGQLQTQPQMIGLIPVIGAFGKYLRDKYPTVSYINWLPF